jgi:putative endonuclease
VNKRKIGKEKEELAKAYLLERGYEILEENFYTRFGEIDLIAREGGYLVFIEVKYRSSTRTGVPEASVTPQKQRKIIKAAEYYLYKRGYSFDTPMRFDVISILKEEYRLIQNAFEAGGFF